MSERRVIVLNETHLRRLVRDYIAYYHEDRTHDALNKDAPLVRHAAARIIPSYRQGSLERPGAVDAAPIWLPADFWRRIGAVQFI